MSLSPTIPARARSSRTPFALALLALALAGAVAGPVAADPPPSTGTGDDRVTLAGYSPGFVVPDDGPIDGTTVAITSFERFEVIGFASFTFRGSDGDEYLRTGRLLSVEDRSAEVSTAQIDMGGGDDQLAVGSTVVGTWSGGPGVDLVQPYREYPIASSPTGPGLLVDLAGGRVHVRGSSSSRIDSWERVEAASSSVRVLGSRHDDDIHLTGCELEVRAGLGADLVDVESDADRCRPERRTSC